MGLSSPVDTTVTARATVLEKGILEKLAHLAAALADECQHNGIEAARAGEHGKKRRLADAGARKNADALAGAERRKEIEHAHAGFQGRANPVAPHRGRGLAITRELAVAFDQRSAAVDRSAEGVDGPAFPGWMRAKADEAVPPGGVAEAGLDGRLEGFHRGTALVDAHHLGELGAGAEAKAHALAELQVARQAGDAEVGRRDLRHHAADVDKRESCGGAADGLGQGFELMAGA